MPKISKKNENSAEVAPKKSKNDNLKKGKKFTPETGKEAQIKSVEKRKENKAYKDAAKEALNALLSQGAMEFLTDIEHFETLPTKDKLAILEHLRDSAGEKPSDKLEHTGADGWPLSIQKVFITQKEQAEADKHIDDVINGN